MTPACEVPGCPALVARRRKRCTVHLEAAAAPELRAVGRACMACGRRITADDWLSRERILPTTGPEKTRWKRAGYRHVDCTPARPAPETPAPFLFEELDT